MIIKPTSRTLEDSVKSEPAKDDLLVSLVSGFKEYLAAGTGDSGLLSFPLLRPSQIDHLLQMITSCTQGDEVAEYDAMLYIKELLQKSYHEGDNDFVLHASAMCANGVTSLLIGRPSERLRLTLIGSFFYVELARGSKALDLTINGDCDYLGNFAIDNSFIVNGKCGNGLQECTRVNATINGDTGHYLGMGSQELNLAVNGDVGQSCYRRARSSKLTLLGSFDKGLGRLANGCTFRLSKEHYNKDNDCIDRRCNEVELI